MVFIAINEFHFPSLFEEAPVDENTSLLIFFLKTLVQPFVLKLAISEARRDAKEKLKKIKDEIKEQEKDELRAKGKPQPAEGDDGSEMPRKLRKYFQSPDFDFIQFLKNPVPDELGMVYFRVIGDHKQNELFVILDYDVEAFGDLVMTAKKKTVRGKKKKEEASKRCRT